MDLDAKQSSDFSGLHSLISGLLSMAAGRALLFRPRKSGGLALDAVLRLLQDLLKR